MDLSPPANYLRLALYTLFDPDAGAHLRRSSAEVGVPQGVDLATARLLTKTGNYTLQLIRRQSKLMAPGRALPAI